MVSDGHLFCICDSISCPQSIAGISPLPRDQSHLWEGVQFSSVAQSCPTLCDPMNRSTPGLHAVTNSQSSLKLTSIKSVMPSSHLILGRPLLLLPPTPPSITVFSNESTLCMRWPVLEFQLQHHSLQRNPMADLLQNGLVGYPCRRHSRVFSNTTVQKHQFFGTSLHYGPTFTSIHDHWKNHSLD